MKLFLEHPHSVGESYFAHGRSAWRFGLKMVFGGFACFIHSIFPFLFQTSASDCVFGLYDELVNRKRRMALHRMEALGLTETEISIEAAPEALEAQQG